MKPMQKNPNLGKSKEKIIKHLNEVGYAHKGCSKCRATNTAGKKKVYHEVDCAINASEVADEFKAMGCTCKKSNTAIDRFRKKFVITVPDLNDKPEHNLVASVKDLEAFLTEEIEKARVEEQARIIQAFRENWEAKELKKVIKRVNELNEGE